MVSFPASDISAIQAEDRDETGGYDLPWSDKITKVESLEIKLN
jgi:hypothetical protein